MHSRGHGREIYILTNVILSRLPVMWKAFIFLLIKFSAETFKIFLVEKLPFCRYKISSDFYFVFEFDIYYKIKITNFF